MKKIIKSILLSFIAMGVGLGACFLTIDNINVKPALAADTLVSQTKASYDTTRIFVHNSNAGNWTSSGALTSIRAWGGSNQGGATIYSTQWVDAGNNTWIGYADIPIDSEGFQLVRINPNNAGEIWNWGPNANLGDAYYSSYIYSLSEYDWSWTYNTDFTLSTINADFAKILLEGYNTCSNSTLNGFGAYSVLQERYFSKMSSGVKQETLNPDYDYDEYVSNDYSYEGLTKKETTLTIDDKINQLAQMYAGEKLQSTHLYLANNTNENMIIILAVSFIGASSLLIVGFIVYKRKRMSK